MGFMVWKDSSETPIDGMYDGPWVTTVDKKELQDAYAGWEKRCTSLFEVRASF